jgi:hypothetical protein
MQMEPGAKGILRTPRACYIALRAARPANSQVGEKQVSDEADPYSLRGKPPYELEIMIATFGGSGAGASDLKKTAAARGELTRQQREHERDLVDKQLAAADKQLAAANSVKRATVLAAIAAAASAIGTIVQAAMAWLSYR